MKLNKSKSIFILSCIIILIISLGNLVTVLGQNEHQDGFSVIPMNTVIDWTYFEYDITDFVSHNSDYIYYLRFVYEDWASPYSSMYIDELTIEVNGVTVIYDGFENNSIGSMYDNVGSVAISSTAYDGDYGLQLLSSSGNKVVTVYCSINGSYSGSFDYGISMHLPVDTTVISFWAKGGGTSDTCNGGLTVYYENDAYVYPTPTPTPTPTPSPSPSPSPTPIITPTPFYTNWLPLLSIVTSIQFILLVIIIIIGVVGYLAVGGFGFFIGVNVASIIIFIMGYLPFWILILLIFIDALLVYGALKTNRGMT